MNVIVTESRLALARPAIGQPLAAQRPKLLEQERRGDHRRPGVEGESLLLPVVAAPARLVACLDNRRRDPRRLQPDGERKPAKAGADNNGGTGHFQSSFVSAASARRTDTGGFPARMRNLSAAFDRPA